MIRKSTWEAYFKYPKAFSLPSNWQELGVFFFWFYVMLLWSLEQRGRYKRQMEEKKKKPSAFKQQHEFRLKAPVWGPV